MLQFYELVRELLGLGKDVGEAAFQKANRALHRYFSFLKSISLGFILFLVFATVLFVFGAAFEFRPAISSATFVGGVAVFLWLLAIFPIVWAVSKGFEWESVRKAFEWIGVATLWIFFLSIYFYLVPVPIAAIPLVFVLCAAMAIASVLFGIGISTRFIALRLGVVFTVMTVFFVLAGVFPSSFGGFGKLFAWFDTKTSEGIDDITVSLVQPIPYSPDLVFFDPNGKPLVWYYKTDAGGHELYKGIRRHPRYGSELQPVTEVVVRELERLERERARNEEEERIAVQKKQEEEQRLAEVKKLVEDAKKAAGNATNQRVSQVPVPGPAGPQGVQGPPGPVGPAGISPSLPEKRRISIPAGTPLEVVLDQSLSTARNKVGDRVRMSLTRSVSIDESVVFPVGAEFTGLVLQLERPGQVKGVAVLALALVNVSFEGNIVSVQTETIKREGQGTKAKDAGKVAVTSGIGAAIGAIFGGKEGAAKGALIGGGAGTTGVIATRGEDLELKPETRLVFELARDLTLELQ